MQDRTPLPPVFSGNAQNRRYLEYDAADAYVLAHAMMIARNTAMMCSSPLTVQRMEHYRQMFMEHAPADAKLLGRCEDLCEIAIAMQAAPAWRMYWLRENSWDSRGDGGVLVGGRAWPLAEWRQPASFVWRVAAVLQPLAPASCVQQPPVFERGQWESE